LPFKCDLRRYTEGLKAAAKMARFPPEEMSGVLVGAVQVESSRPIA
jgi:hypothetical protein